MNCLFYFLFLHTVRQFNRLILLIDRRKWESKSRMCVRIVRRHRVRKRMVSCIFLARFLWDNLTINFIMCEIPCQQYLFSYTQAACIYKWKAHVIDHISSIVRHALVIVMSIHIEHIEHIEHCWVHSFLICSNLLRVVHAVQLLASNLK